MDTITNKPPARCLDLSRSVSRVGRGPLTGIDRVELEYLCALMASDVPLYGLVRLAGGHAILDRDGVVALLHRLSGQIEWGHSDAIARLSMKLSDMQGRAQSDVRRLSTSKSRKTRLKQMVKKVLPTGCAYLNVGHSNISMPVFAALKSVEGLTITVMIHDAIPLDFPQFQRAGTVQKFDEKLRAVSRYGDQVICISRDSKASVVGHLSRMGRTPQTLVSNIGVTVARPDIDALPAGIDLSTPYFVTVGTIEPRKNHQLLLDVWENLNDRPNPPNLYVVGQRGWNNRKVFDRLDQGIENVFEFGDLGDGAVSALMQGSRAVLCPSFAEGFGLPAAEAAMLGVPVICNNLRVFHDILGKYPIYLEGTDIYGWATMVENLSNSFETVNNGALESGRVIRLATWDEHFQTVLGMN